MAPDSQPPNTYKRKVSLLEQMYFHSPYAIVTMLARIKGVVTEEMFRAAVKKAQQRHPLLRMRIEIDQDQVPWFTEADVKEIPIDVLRGKNKDQWMEVYQQYSQVPFDFDLRPAIRFVLIQSPESSDLMIICHHMICDGLSLAYLARDILYYLGEPSREVEVLPDMQPMDKDNLPVGVKMNSLVNLFVKRINDKWLSEKITFTQEDYQALSEAYWPNVQHRTDLIEFSEDQTSQLVEDCKKNAVTVNSALSVALAAAQIIVQGIQPHHDKVTVAGNMRDRLEMPVGEDMGLFAGAVSLNFKYNPRKDFWENTRKFNDKVQPLYTNKNLFKDPLVWCYLESGILESLSFKMIGKNVSEESEQYQKLKSFSERDDVISSMLKREKMDTVENILIGTAVTNLTRLDFPRHYGELELDRLIMKPGGAFPLVFVNLLAGAVTCSGKLSLVLEYAEERISSDMVEQVKTRMIEILDLD